MAANRIILVFIFCAVQFSAWAQCSSLIMEPGFQFLSSSRGCAPFYVEIQTNFLKATPGTQYYINWGDGGPEEIYTQTGPTGVTISHTYNNSPVECGYDLIIDAENACNPRGSVVPIQTQVIVWTNDIVSIAPGVLRVCQGFAANVLFQDNSDWNCNPRATRQNADARWLQWIYGSGPSAIQIPGIKVNNITPGSFPYLNPAPSTNPKYPILAPGDQSLSINVPITGVADIGKEFEITLKNWNQCNAYDNVLTDNNPFNPVSGNLVNGDNAPQTVTARIVIVNSPEPDFLTRLGNSSGAIQTTFCVGEDIFFDNETPAIAGAQFKYIWQFYDNNTGIGSPLSTSTGTNPTFNYTTSGQKLIRLTVHDANAAGNCDAIIEKMVTISPSLAAKIQVTDLSGNIITPDFCQENVAPFATFNARFSDVSLGTATPTTLWRWEFYNESNTLVFEAPSGGGFASSPQGPFDRAFTNPGAYRVRLRIRDNLTSCETEDEVTVRVFRNPLPDFTFSRVCEGNATEFTDASTLNAVLGQTIISREWDMDYDGTTFTKDASLDNKTQFDHTFTTTGSHVVALSLTTSPGGCSRIIQKTVIVDPAPNALFVPDRTSGCSKLTINFTNNSINGQPAPVNLFTWEVDDGTGFKTDKVQTPSDPDFSPVYSRVFINTGTTNFDYKIRLKVRTTNGCESISNVETITVFPGTKSGFSSPLYSPFNDNCNPVTVKFNVDPQTQSLNPTDYTWTITDASGNQFQTSTGTAPTYTHQFINNSQIIKDFNVTLRSTLPSSCYGDSTRVIRVNPRPSSAFALTTVSADCYEVKLQAEALQKGLPQYDWTVSINNVVMLSTITTEAILNYNVNRSNSTDQLVEIKLITTNFANCPSTATTNAINVVKTDNLNASFTATPATQTLPNSTIQITNNTSAGPWQYTWDFGDGQTSSSSSVTSHTYDTYGTYTIKLTVSNGDCTDEAESTITIDPIPPILDFTYDPGAGCAPLTINFTNASQYADATTYQWSFGDNEGTSNALNPSYTYYEPGEYSVTLSASNVLGETVSITKSLIIEVYEKPRAIFNLKPKQVQLPGGKLYTDNQSVGATNFLWDFGDGTTSIEFEPEHIYKSEGQFDVTLQVSNIEGCTDEAKLIGAVETIKTGELLIPNAFTPNTSGSTNSFGQNDVFKPKIRGVTDYQLLIFNRWGELLFDTRDPEQGWDGFYNGKPCQQDVYVYKIIARNGNGQQIKKVGDVHLIR